MTVDEWLDAITACMESLNYCVARRQDLMPDHPDPMGVTIGECDWLGALHDLLYDTEVKCLK